MPPAPQPRRARADAAFRLFHATWRRIAEAFARHREGSALEWLAANRPELLAEAVAADAAVDEQARRYVEGEAADDAAFRAAGSAWFAAWKRAAAALPGASAPDTASAPESPSAPAAEASATRP